MADKDNLNEYLQLSRQLTDELAKLEQCYQQVEKIVGESIQFTSEQRRVYHEWLDQLHVVKGLGEKIEKLAGKTSQSSH